MDDIKTFECQFCKHELVVVTGSIDQCSNTCIPANVTECLTCEYKRWDPVLHPFERSWLPKK